MQMSTFTKPIEIRSTSASRQQARPGRACWRAPIPLKLYAGVVALTLALSSACAGAGESNADEQSANGAISAVDGAPTQSATAAQSVAAERRHYTAYFGQEQASREARQIADWIVDSADNQGLPFVVVDKIDTKVFVFDAGGRIRGAAPALLGAARGDYTVPGIGDRALSDQPPETRTTPAGRFVAELGVDSHGQDVVWVDYRAAVALHRVMTTNPEERRLERLATPTPRDNRISWGCINVPARFYETVVKPAFTGTNGIVYVLPETVPTRAVFNSYSVDDRMDRSYADRSEATR
jgi:hypothetical protein